MSNSILFGHIDRRRRIPFDEFRVKMVYDAIFEEHGVRDVKLLDFLETERITQRKASRGLGAEDREEIGKFADTLQKKLDIGRDAALCILAHIGVMMNACHQGRRARE